MNREQVKDVLVAVLSDIQTLSGRPVPPFHGDLCPMRDLHGFDSLNAVEASLELSGRYGCEIEADVALFKRDGRERSLDEIVDDLVKAVGGKNGG